jgi:DNA-binding transcriptional regulator LsrR (DeoR family)
MSCNPWHWRAQAAAKRGAKVAELRYFAGLENSEISALMGFSEPTVVRDWRFARAWLYTELQPEA